MFDPYADNNDFEDFFAYQMEYPEYEPQRNTRIEDYWYEDPGTEYDYMDGDEYDDDPEDCSDESGADGKNLVDFDDILNVLGKNLFVLNGLGKNSEDCSGVPDDSNDGRDYGSGQCHICDDGRKDSGCNDGKYHIEQHDDFGEGESE